MITPEGSRSGGNGDPTGEVSAPATAMPQPEHGRGPGMQPLPSRGTARRSTDPLAAVDPDSWHGPVIGVLGGLGPAATAIFLDLLVRATAASSDQEHLDVLVSQHSSTPDRTAGILHDDAPDPGPVLARDAHMLERMGSDVLVLPCNTAHHFVQGVLDATTVPFVSIVEATMDTVEQVIATTGGSVGVFATEGTIAARVYQDAIEHRGLTPLVPDPALQAEINALIYEQVKAGRPIDRGMVARTIAQAKAAGAGVIVLGCTELSVIYDRLGMRGEAGLVDSLTELARATVLAAGRELSPDFQSAPRAAAEATAGDEGSLPE